jgi:hypothetical protein
MCPRMPGDERFDDRLVQPHHRSACIILLPFPWIGENLVGLLDLLKLCLPFLARVIRMILLGQTPISPSDGMRAFCGSHS